MVSPFVLTENTPIQPGCSDSGIRKSGLAICAMAINNVSVLVVIDTSGKCVGVIVNKC